MAKRTQAIDDQIAASTYDACIVLRDRDGVAISRKEMLLPKGVAPGDVATYMQGMRNVKRLAGEMFKLRVRYGGKMLKKARSAFPSNNALHFWYEDRVAEGTLEKLSRTERAAMVWAYEFTTGERTIDERFLLPKEATIFDFHNEFTRGIATTERFRRRYNELVAEFDKPEPEEPTVPEPTVEAPTTEGGETKPTSDGSDNDTTEGGEESKPEPAPTTGEGEAPTTEGGESTTTETSPSGDVKFDPAEELLKEFPVMANALITRMDEFGKDDLKEVVIMYAKQILRKAEEELAYIEAAGDEPIAADA